MKIKVIFRHVRDNKNIGISVYIVDIKWTISISPTRRSPLIEETRPLFHRMKLAAEQLHGAEEITAGMRGVLASRDPGQRTVARSDRASSPKHAGSPVGANSSASPRDDRVRDGKAGREVACVVARTSGYLSSSKRSG